MDNRAGARGLAPGDPRLRLQQLIELGIGGIDMDQGISGNVTCEPVFAVQPMLQYSDYTQRFRANFKIRSGRGHANQFVRMAQSGFEQRRGGFRIGVRVKSIDRGWQASGGSAYFAPGSALRL
jgi:hypothetical protein